MSQSYPAALELSFDEISVGQTFELLRSFSAQDVLAFAALSGDYSPLHVDRDYAAGTEFGAQVVHGVLLASLFSQLVGMLVPGKHALYLGQDLTFRRPVLIDETVRADAKVVGKSDATRTLVLNTEIRSMDHKVLVMGTAKVKVRSDLPAKQVAEISVRELHDIRQRGLPHFLLDVREPDEYETAQISGSTLIPLSQVGDRAAEIPREIPVYVHCKLGGRSARAVASLQKLGFHNVTNVAGGITAWSDEIDASVPRY